jgi:hypothetical protein
MVHRSFAEGAPQDSCLSLIRFRSGVIDVVWYFQIFSCKQLESRSSQWHLLIGPLDVGAVSW